MEFFGPVLECVDRGLDEYGEGMRGLVYSSLRDSFNFTRQEAVFNPEGFKQCLESKFTSASRFFERSITNAIANRFSLKLENQFDMVGAINLARNILSEAEEVHTESLVKMK